jgi:hypothetical protein
MALVVTMRDPWTTSPVGEGTGAGEDVLEAWFEETPQPGSKE